MSQAEALLNSLSEEVPVHTHPVPDTDSYFIIDPITRTVENTNRKKTVVMQYDHNSERFTFQLPRYVDGHDMLECTSVTVNADNIEAETGNTNSDAPDMTDLRLNPNDPETVISSWCISRTLTQLAGILSFSIEYKCVDKDGNVVYEWSTDTYDKIEVKARKKNGEAAVVEHTDLLEQWRTRIFGAGDSVMVNITAEGEAQVAAVKMESETQQEAVELKGAQTLDMIPEDYTEVDAMADEAVRSKGDAIVCEAAGESIVLKDSSNDYIRGLKLFGKSSQVTTTGKNLFKTSFAPGYTETIKGVTVTVNPDKSIHIKGTPTAAIAYNIFEGEAFTIGNYFLSGAPSTSSQKFRLQVNLTVDGTEKTGGVDMGMGSSFSVDESVSSLRGYIYVAVDAGEVDGTFYPQIEVGVAATTYEPYTGGKSAPNPDYPQDIVNLENPVVDIYGKNLLDISCGVNECFVDNGDGTYTITKLSADKRFSAHIPLNIPAGVRIIFSFKTTERTCEQPIQMQVFFHDETTTTLATDREQMYDKPIVSARLYLAVADAIGTYGTIKDCLIEVGDVVTEHEPYKSTQSLAISRTLPGIPVPSGGNYTDENGQQWICDEVDLERGVYVQRVLNYTFTGNESWYLHESGRYYAAIGNALGLSFVSQCALCTHASIYKRADRGDYCTNGTGGFYFNQSDTFNTVDELKTYLQANVVTAYIALSTPIETPLTAEEITAFKALRTNYPNTTILNDAGAWMSVKYNADTKSYIENPKILKLTDSSTGVVYELKIVDGNLTVTPV